MIMSILSAAGLTYLFREWTFREIRHVFVLIIFGFLAVLTTRASFRASYITYDQATEFLVYAHGATGIKEIIAQAKEISERTTGGMGVAILSTSKGLITNKKARPAKCGGEVLCHVW